MKVINKETILTFLKSHQKQLFERYQLTKIGLFGSFAREEQTSDSDVDILVDYEKAPSLITLIQLENYLSESLEVRVDLVTLKGLKPQLKSEILQEVVYI